MHHHNYHQQHHSLQSQPISSLSSFTKLSHFTPLSKLGQGSFSSVYKVQRAIDNQIYALKKIKIAFLKKKQKQNALNQIRILASLSSNYIIKYKQAFFDQKYQLLCIVMELADQGDLYARIKQKYQKRQLFSQKQIWKAIGHIVKGLKLLHDNNIMHRDLKSSNIFICQNIYKLGDLNVSKIQSNSRKLAFTQTGTPYYASPQVWRDEPYDFKSDIWSLGCIIYEMCQLKPPFVGQNMEQLYQNIQKGIYSSISPYYSSQLNQIISKCLTRNARFRPSCSQLLSAYNSRFSTKQEDKQFLDVHFKIISMMKTENQLLSTIKLDQDNLANLKKQLPKSNYQNKRQNNNKQLNINDSYNNNKYTQVKQKNNNSQKKQINNSEALQNNNKSKQYYINQLENIKNKYKVRNNRFRVYSNNKQRQKSQFQKIRYQKPQKNQSNERYQKKGRSLKINSQKSQRIIIQSNISKNNELKIKKRQLNNLLKIDSSTSANNNNVKRVHSAISQKLQGRPKINNDYFQRIRALKGINKNQIQNKSNNQCAIHYSSNQQIKQNNQKIYKSQNRYGYLSLFKNNYNLMISAQNIDNQNNKKLRIRAEQKLIQHNPKIKNHYEYKLNSLVRSINSRSTNRQSIKNLQGCKKNEKYKHVYTSNKDILGSRFQQQHQSEINNNLKSINQRYNYDNSNSIINSNKQYLRLNMNPIKRTKTDLSINKSTNNYNSRNQQQQQQPIFKTQVQENYNNCFHDRQYRSGNNSIFPLSNLLDRKIMVNSNKNILTNTNQQYLQKVYPSTSINKPLSSKLYSPYNLRTNRQNQIAPFLNHNYKPKFNQEVQRKENFENGSWFNGVPRMAKIIERVPIRKQIFQSQKMIAEKYYRKLVSKNILQ